jgi:cytochrome P450
MNPAATTYPSKSIWSVRRARQNPISFLHSLAKRGDIVPFSLAGHPAFLLNHPDHVEDVLVVNHARFEKSLALRRSATLLGTGLLTAEGTLHQERRRLLQPAFSHQRLERYSQTIVECTRRLHERWRDGDVVDMAAEMHGLTAAIIGKILFGADLTPHTAEIERALTAAAASIDPLLSLLAPSRRLRPASRYLRGVVDDLIDHHEPGSEDDVLTLLRRAEGSDGEVSDQLRDDVLTLFVAGHDTIANALIWTWHLLAEHREVEVRLHEELHRVLDGHPPVFEHVEELVYTGRVLAESLRLYPPSWVITRRALCDHLIGGTPIRSGAIVVVSQYLLHHDARFFADPLAFDPDRWVADSDNGDRRPRHAYLPFGAGPRSCIGQGLGTMEGVLLLAGIAQRWQPTPLKPIECDPRATLRPRGPVPTAIRAVSDDSRSRRSG